jgi:hypothetical protein
VKLSADVFPAIVAIAPPESVSDIVTFAPRGVSPQGTRRLDRCRVSVYNNILMIAIDSESGPKTVFKEICTFLEKGEDKIFRAKTETGKILSFKKENNCGCGSRLRAWNPVKESGA